MSSILFADIALLDEQGTYRPHTYVGVRDSRIDYVGQTMPTQAYGEIYDGRGKLLMPGLYNAHAHAPMTLLRGRGENLPLHRWLDEAVFPFEDELSDEDVYYGTLLGIAEMLRFGTVSFSDMYYHSDARAEAVLDSGIKCNLSHSIVSFDPSQAYRDIPQYAINEHLVSAYHHAGDDKLLVDFSLHAEYTSTPQVVADFAQATREAGLRMQVHVSETAKEVEECRRRHNMTPVAYLDSAGLFDVPTTAAHCVALDDEDFAILAAKEVTVATCPASNAKLGSGIADVARMRAEGIPVALGTDGVASNNNHNMFSDMYLLALMQRAERRDPVGLPVGEVISIATRNGALSQGRDDCASVAIGMKADLLVMDIDTPWMNPVEDMASNVVYAAQGSDVVLTMVDGVVLYRDGLYPTIDVERVTFEVCRARERIVSALGEKSALR